ncbi:hypothetical protein BDZ97DRAFT_288892 [Flammula alnicola]|nr:hypothetical protein BDZ97DRAFT_288892 [Flammula alnicola]
MLKAIATSAYRAVTVVCTSVVVSFALGKIPLVGDGWIYIFVLGRRVLLLRVCLDRPRSFSFSADPISRRALGVLLRFWTTVGDTMHMGIRSRQCSSIRARLPCVYSTIMAMHARPVLTEPYNPMPPIPSQ